MTVHRQFRASSRRFTHLLTALRLAILAAAIAVTVTACEQNHYDMYLGTEAGADFDAPAREAMSDSATGGAAGDSGGAAGTGGAAGDSSGAAGTGGAAGDSSGAAGTSGTGGSSN